jgi:hypothetical protein
MGKRAERLFTWHEQKSALSLKYTMHTPQECGLSREAKFQVYVIKEIPDESSFEGTRKLWFVQDCTMKVRDDETSNIWLKLGDADRKYYLCDLSEVGLLLRCPLQSGGNVVVEKSELRPVSIDSVREAYADKSKAFYAFGKVEEQDCGVSV